MKCVHCHIHEASTSWVGHGGVLDYAHGFSEPWCKCCVLKEQIKYAEEQIEEIETFKKDLEELNCE